MNGKSWNGARIRHTVGRKSGKDYISPMPAALDPSGMGPDRTRIHRGHTPRPFRPASWLPGAHLQTLAGKFLRPTPDPGLRRERWETPDGDFLDLDFAPPPRPDAPPVLILHGLEGSTGRGYVRVLMRELHHQGLLPIGLNFRSCSGEPNRVARFYHSGETGDLIWALGRLRERFPHRPLGAVGFSLGGNVLLRHLGISGIRAIDEGTPVSLVDAAVAISVPFDLVAGTRALEAGPMGRLYTRYFLRSLLEKSKAKEALLRPLLDWDALHRARTLREFDEVATAPLHGFDDAWDYYRQSSSGPHLRSIRIPTLLLHSDDDPFLPPRSAPRDAVRENPWLLAGFPRRGGHVGFVEGPGPWAPRFWAEAEAARYLAHRLPGSGKPNALEP